MDRQYKASERVWVVPPGATEPIKYINRVPFDYGGFSSYRYNGRIYPGYHSAEFPGTYDGEGNTLTHKRGKTSQAGAQP